jgi:hypothetical protein
MKKQDKSDHCTPAEYLKDHLTPKKVDKRDHCTPEDYLKDYLTPKKAGRLMLCVVTGCNDEPAPAGSGTKKFCHMHHLERKNLSSTKSRKKAAAKGVFSGTTLDAELAHIDVTFKMLAVDMLAPPNIKNTSDDIKGVMGSFTMKHYVPSKDEVIPDRPKDELILDLDTLGNLRASCHSLRNDQILAELQVQARTAAIKRATSTTVASAVESALIADVGDGNDDDQHEFDRILLANEDDTWFLVKWMGVPVMQSTWTQRHILDADAPGAVPAFLEGSP